MVHRRTEQKPLLRLWFPLSTLFSCRRPSSVKFNAPMTMRLHGMYVHFVHDSDARCAFHHYWERTLCHTDSRGSAKQWIAIFRATQHGQYIQCHIIPTIWEVGKLVIFEFMTMMSRSIPGCFCGLLKVKCCLSVQLIILFFCHFTIIIIIGIRCELIDKGSVAIRYKYQRPTQQCECYAEGVIYHQKTFICYWNIILLICWWS